MSIAEFYVLIKSHYLYETDKTKYKKRKSKMLNKFIIEDQSNNQQNYL